MFSSFLLTFFSYNTYSGSSTVNKGKFVSTTTITADVSEILPYF